MRDDDFKRRILERKNLQKKLQSRLKSLGGLAERIENSVGVGTADLACVYKQVDFWIETKIDRGKGPELDADQKAWHTQRYLAGSRTFIATRKAVDLDTNTFTLHRFVVGEGSWRLELRYLGQFPKVDWRAVFDSCLT